MIVSPTPGLITQMTSLLTKQRYKYATIYVDQASWLGYVYLQADAIVETTLKSKRAYERLVLLYGITVRGYHTDNSIFKANGLGKWL